MALTEWLLSAHERGNPDTRLDSRHPGNEAWSEGNEVRPLVHGATYFAELFDRIETTGQGDLILFTDWRGNVLLDMRVPPRGSHHQKMVVIRHADAPRRDVAYVGGIDLCHSRRDDARHRGDPQAQSMSEVYGVTPPWHDVQCAISGPAVYDAETVFRERWEDPAP